MKSKKLLIAIVCISAIISSSLTSAQQKIAYTKSEPRNSWGLGLVYSESGFGISGTKFSPIGRKSDLFLNLQVTGVTDSREFEQFDYYGNSVIPNKINRVYVIPLSIGVRNELFKDDIEGDFSPSINFGVTPALVLTSPYNRSFFNSLGYVSTKFALGGFAGLGVNFQQGDGMSMGVNLSYYYLSVLGGGVKSVEYNTINNVGGLQLMFGINFLN